MTPNAMDVITTPAKVVAILHPAIENAAFKGFKMAQVSCIVLSCHDW